MVTPRFTVRRRTASTTTWASKILPRMMPRSWPISKISLNAILTLPTRRVASQMKKSVSAVSPAPRPRNVTLSKRGAVPWSLVAEMA